MTLLGSKIVNDQLPMQIILPLKMCNTVSGFFVFVVTHQEEVIELVGDELLQVLYLLGSEQSMVGVLFY